MSPGEPPMDRMQFHNEESVVQFSCRLLEHSLIKFVIFLAYILYCLKKYTYRGCAYFVVLGGMIFESSSFPPEASSSSSCPDQELQSASNFVDKCGFKTDRKNVRIRLELQLIKCA